ncbi:MAG: glycosyltransferase family 4 protein, partial [Longimicrobiales bacterium]
MTLLVSGWPNAAGIEQVDGMEVHRVGGRHTYFLRAATYYRRVLRDRGFDLVVEDLNKVPLFSTYWAVAPVVLLVHHLFGGTAFQEASLPIAAGTWALERPIPLCYKHVPVQAVSRSTADDLERRGFRPDRITVIPNGVDLDFYRPDASDARFTEPTLLYLGRLKRYKRIDLVLRSLALLRAQGVPARLIVAGKGDAADDLRRLASELDIAEHVSMPGYVDEGEKRSLFRRSWVHVLTSPKEGWGISNLEAAACGTPTVASDSPGLRDSVVDGETGYLVPHGDVPALAGRLRLILEDAILRERLGATARRFALEFSWD